MTGNSNINANILRLRASPVESLTLNLFYVYTRLNEKQASQQGPGGRPVDPRVVAIGDKDLSHEVDLIADWTVNKYLSASVVTAVLIPMSGAKDFFGNDVLWTGDDGMELDYAHRNVRAFGNRITNAQMGVSFQPVWGGPVYVFRNVLVNMARSPYKLNNDPTGFYIFNNTSVRTLGFGNNLSFAWPSLGYLQADGEPAYAANFEFRNNLLIGVSTPAFVTTKLFDAKIDSNGWWPDGTFVFFNTWANLADLISNSPYEANGRIVEAQPFVVPIVLGATYTTQVAPRSPLLAPGSAAVDGGQVIPNVSDTFSGSAPDLGRLGAGRRALRLRRAAGTGYGH